MDKTLITAGLILLLMIVIRYFVKYIYPKIDIDYLFEDNLSILIYVPKIRFSYVFWVMLYCFYLDFFFWLDYLIRMNYDK